MNNDKKFEILLYLNLYKKKLKTFCNLYKENYTRNPFLKYVR